MTLHAQSQDLNTKSPSASSSVANVSAFFNSSSQPYNHPSTTASVPLASFVSDVPRYVRISEYVAAKSRAIVTFLIATAHALNMLG